MAIDFKEQIEINRNRKNAELMNQCAELVIEHEANILKQIERFPLETKWTSKVSADTELGSVAKLKEVYGFLVERWVNEGRTQMHVSFRPEEYRGSIRIPAAIEFYVTGGT